MHFHADGGGLPGSYCGPGLAWRVIHKIYRWFGPGLHQAQLSRCVSLWVLLATIVGSSRSVGALGGLDPKGGPVCLDRLAAGCL